MKYVLSSLKITEDPLQAVKDAIMIGYNTDERDIRYDTLPSFNNLVTTKDNDSRDLIISERVRQLIDEVQKSLGLEISISKFTVDNKSINLSILVGGSLINLTL